MMALVYLMLSLRVSRAHIVILALYPNRLTDKQTDTEKGRKPPSTSIMIDTKMELRVKKLQDAAEDENTRSRYFKHRPGYINVLACAHNMHTKIHSLHTHTRTSKIKHCPNQ